MRLNEKEILLYWVWNDLWIGRLLVHWHENWMLEMTCEICW